MNDKQTYYQILEISVDATQEEIKKAYRKMARKYHPDVSQETGTEEKMKKVNEAYETLSDIEKRKIYDKTVMQVGSQNHQKAYESYTKTKEESEEDLEDWLKNYLKIKRNLNKLIDEYVKIESANVRRQKYYYAISNQNILYSKLLVQEIAKLFNTMYVSARTNPEIILEYLLTEIASLAEAIEIANAQYREEPAEIQIRFRLFIAEITLFQKNYICEGKDGYDSVLKYVLKKYLKIQESNAFCRHEFRAIPYSNTLQLEILEKMIEENKEYINKLLANGNKKGKFNH